MIRIGIIGIGAIANTYIGLIKEEQIHGKLTAISSRNQENITKVLEKFELEHIACFNNHTALLKSGEVDMVIICTPHQTHIEIAKEALRYGVHPLIEKPIDIDLKAAEDFLVYKKNYEAITCGVAYCNRMAKGYQEVKALLNRGAIGRLKRCSYMMTSHYRTMAYHHSASWRGTYEAEGGGVLMTQASHQLDILLWLCGVPEKVYGFCYEGKNRDIEVENDAHIHMEYEEGFTAQFTASSHELPGTNRLEISGEKGKIVLEDGCQLTYIQLPVSEPEFAQTATGWFGDLKTECCKIEVEEMPIEYIQAKLINDFIEAIKQKRAPICTVEEAVVSLRVIQGVYQSSRENKGVPIKEGLN